MKRAMSDWGPVALYASVIFYLSSLPSLKPLPIFELLWELDPEKFVFHLFEYSILGYLLLRAVVNSNNTAFAEKALLTATLLGFAYGISDEFHQYFVPFRTASFTDALADGMGCFMGAYSRSDIWPRVLRFLGLPFQEDKPSSYR